MICQFIGGGMDRVKTNRKIRAYMAQKAWTQKVLANYLEIAQSTLNSKLNEQASWKDEELFKLSQLFNCSVDYLLKDK